MGDVLFVDFKEKRLTGRFRENNGKAPDLRSETFSDEGLRDNEQSLIDAQGMLSEALGAGFNMTQAIIIIPHSDLSQGIAICAMDGFESDQAEIDLLKEAIAKLEAMQPDPEADDCDH